MSRRGGPVAYAALVAVCFFWGTTYLAIRISIEHLRPAIVISGRFLIAGAILLAIARARGVHRPSGYGLRTACASGIVVLGIGTAGTFYAELFIPSSFASLLVTISPFIMVAFEAALGGEALQRRTIVGMAVGFSGAGLLLLPGSGTEAFARSTLIGFSIMMVGITAWCLGSIYQRRQPSEADSVFIAGIQNVAAGLLYIPIALFIPGPVVWTARGLLALLYLAIFGSVVAYTAFVIAMDRLPVAIASIYPYINAVVAVALGWLFFREPFGAREVMAMLLIFTGVVIVKATGSRGGVKPVQTQAARAAVTD